MPHPDQDWNSASRVTVNISGLSPDAIVSVYNRMPGSEDTYIAAEFSASHGTCTFDYPEGRARLYIVAARPNGTVEVSGSYDIIGGVANVRRRASRTDEAAASPTPTESIIYAWSNDQGIQDHYDWVRYVPGIAPSFMGNHFKEDSATPLSKLFDLYAVVDLPATPTKSSAGNPSIKAHYLKPNFEDATTYTCEDLESIVGKNGVFNENISDGDCNLTRYWTDLNPLEGVEYVPDGTMNPVTLEYMYGCGTYANSLGYFFYEETYTEEQIMRCPKYILAMDASPWSNLKKKETDDTDFTIIDTSYLSNDDQVNQAGMLPGKYISRYEDNKSDNTKLQSAKYTLVYRPQMVDPSDNTKIILVPDQPLTYEIPKEMRIGFFLISKGYSLQVKGKGGKVSPGALRFSLPWMNSCLGRTFEYQSASNHTSCSSMPQNTPPLWFVTYKWGVDGQEQFIMGVEDGDPGNTDHDMNDILFKVSGVKVPEKEVKNLTPEEVKVQSWIIACEDLGAALDYDFNDVVFGVSHYTKEVDGVVDESSLYITPLAGGGTLPVKLFYKDKQVTRDNKTYWHELFGQTSAGSIINAFGSGNDISKIPGAIKIDNVPADFKLSSSMFKADPSKDDYMGGFSLRVYDHEGEEISREVVAPGPGDTPQMILLPVEWSWPRESVSINKAYPGVANGDVTEEVASGFQQWCQKAGTSSWSVLTSNKDYIYINPWKGQKKGK